MRACTGLSCIVIRDAIVAVAAQLGLNILCDKSLSLSSNTGSDPV